MQDRLRVEENKSGLRKIFVKFEDPNIAEQIANYIGEYIYDFISNGLVYQAKNNRVFLDQQTKQAAIQLQKSEDKLKFKAQKTEIFFFIYI